MSPGARVQATDVLLHLGDGLGGHSVRVEDAVRHSESIVRSALGLFEDERRNRRFELDHAESSLRSAEAELEDYSYDEDYDDFDETEELERQVRERSEELEEAEASLRAADEVIAILEERLDHHLRRSSELRILWESVGRDAQGFLRSKVQDVDGYVAVGIPVTFDGPGPAESVLRAPGATDPHEAARRATVRQAQAIAGVLTSTPEFRPELWDQLSLRERREALLHLEYTMAELQGRTSRDIEFAPMRPGLTGQFVPDQNLIRVSESMVSAATAEARRDLVATLVHEGRHAYQHDAVRTPGLHGDAAQVEAWRRNLEPGQYVDPLKCGAKAYAEQPIEADAFHFEDLVIAEWTKRSSGAQA